jgi:type II secretory pathway pseudopilin PulG
VRRHIVQSHKWLTLSHEFLHLRDRGRRWPTGRMRGQSSIHGRTGFSLAESLVSVTLAGILMVTSLQSMVTAKRRELNTTEQLSGQQLACALLSEILLQDYKEPQTSVAPVFGLETGESTGNRSLFDDVDDYIGWTESPPVERSGNVIPGFSGWTRTVTVERANADTLAPTTLTNSGLKKMTVTVSRNGITRGSMVGYRGIGWVNAIPSPSDTTGNRGPVAVATSPDLTRSVGQTVELDATTSSDADGDSLSYVWNFGDGTSGSGNVLTHSYSYAGTFTCTLTVYDGRGGIGHSSLTAVISP